MSNLKRATVYFDPDIHRALRLRAAASDKSISDMVNEAVKLTLAEDAEDLARGERHKLVTRSPLTEARDIRGGPRCVS